MSRPLAAKSVGACLKHVLNSRLTPARFEIERGDAVEQDKLGVVRLRIETVDRLGHAPMNWSTLARQPVEPISEDEPLPPADRLVRVRPSGLDLLFRNQRPRLLRMFARRAGQVEADDLVQETFARFARRSEAVAEPVATPEAYLTRVATNLLRDRAKLAVARATAHHQIYDDNVLLGPDPNRCLEARDALRRLEAAVSRLKPRTRAVFLLQRVEGLTYPQIAEQTGMSEKAVKKQMAKALVALRRDLGPL